jgi:ABC-type transporter MlaC component
LSADPGGQAGQRIKVDWRLTGQNGAYKITDVMTNGLSMTITGCSQLQGVAERNGGQPQAILAVMGESANAALR